MDADALYFRLLALLDDPRTFAAGAVGLGALGDPRAIRFLIAHLTGDDLDRAAYASQALNDIDYPDAIAPLLELWSDDLIFQQTGRWTLESLLHHLSPDALSDLKANHPSASLRAFVETVTAPVETPPSAPKPVREELSFDGWTARLATATSARQRRAAVQGLGALGDPRGIEPVTTLLRATDSDRERRHLADTLALLLATQGVDALLAQLDTEGDPGVRNAILLALESVADPRAADVLIRLLTPTSADRGPALLAFEAILSRVPTDRLIGYVARPDLWASARSASADELARRGDATAEAPLLDRLLDAEAGLPTQGIVEALAPLGGPDTLGALWPYLASDIDLPHDLRRAIARTAGTIGRRVLR